MFGLGIWELAIIFLIVVIIFGVGKLPEIGTGLGEGIKNFRKSYKEEENAIDVTPDEDESSSSKTTQKD